MIQLQSPIQHHLVLEQEQHLDPTFFLEAQTEVRESCCSCQKTVCDDPEKKV
jgi:hypothetical protein